MHVCIYFIGDRREKWKQFRNSFVNCQLIKLCLQILGEGTYKVPYKTILQAMRRYGKAPFPVIFQDSKPDSVAAKSGEFGDLNVFVL